MATMTSTSGKKTPTLTVSSTTGSKTHDFVELVELRPGERSGVIQLGGECYLVTSLDGTDELEFEKAGGKATYRVSCWSESRGNHSCQCRDWQFRRTPEQKFCKHLQASFKIKERLERDRAKPSNAAHAVATRGVAVLC